MFKVIYLTGRFPHKSSTVNSYIFLLCDFDTNVILFEPLKTRRSKEIATVYTKCYNKLNKNLLTPCLYISDNEYSAGLKLAIIKIMQSTNLSFHVNIVATPLKQPSELLKPFFLSGLTKCDRNYLIHRWDRLLPQCE